MFRVIISSMIMVISLFIGFFPHSENCGILKLIGYHQCPGWAFHIILGSIFYILAVFISQKDSFDFIISYASSCTSNTSKELPIR